MDDERSRPDFSVESADALLPEVRDRLVALRDAYARLIGHREKVRTLAPSNGGEKEPDGLLEASRQLAGQLRWFEEAGIIVRDIEQGLIDFPSHREGEEVLLCWRLDEEKVAFWHYPDAGFGGRRPL
jgi:hypothetical protein